MLNAFRHHGLFRPGSARGTALRQVLNAFRHHGLFRPPREGVSANDSWCAQRLSASRIISAAPTTVYRPGAIECSTPFGITDYFGAGRRDRSGCSVSVLNAFRHHGLFRTERLEGLSGTEYQVLNAFRHHGLFRARAEPAPTWPRSCAQRLSASRIISAILPSRTVVVRSAQRLSASRIISDR